MGVVAQGQGGAGERQGRWKAGDTLERVDAQMLVVESWAVPSGRALRPCPLISMCCLPMNSPRLAFALNLMTKEGWALDVQMFQDLLVHVLHPEVCSS